MIKSLCDDRSKAIRERIDRIRSEVSAIANQAGRPLDTITLMAVTKTIPAQYVNIAAECGIACFGENRVQEYLDRRESYLPSMTNIHFIGHLQTNKVKYLVPDPKITMIESVDSIHLAREIDRQAKKVDRMMDILVEVNIGGEESKGGIAPELLDSFLKNLDEFTNIRLRGLMAIPPAGGNSEYFAKMRQLFIDICTKKSDNSSIDTLSMGMSKDYTCAIQNGSTQIRLGTAIFGARK